MIREAEENPYMSMSDVIDPPLHLTISLPGSTPLRSFFGGVCAAFPVHALLYFNNNTFGISSFIVTVSPSPQSKDEENEKLHKLREYARDFRRQHTTDAEQFDWDSDDGDYGLAIGRLVVT
jgi:hypothetical protein